MSMPPDFILPHSAFTRSTTIASNTALKFDQALRRDPANVIARLAQAHNVDLGQFGGPQVNENQIRQQLHQQIQAEYQQAIAQQQQQQYAAREQWLMGELQRFADSKKEYWNDKIESEVARQISALKSTDGARVEQDPLWAIKEAHDRALTQLGIESKEKLAERQRKAREAKRLGSLNAKSSSAGSAPRQSLDIYAEMANIYDRVNGGGR